MNINNCWNFYQQKKIHRTIMAYRY